MAAKNDREKSRKCSFLLTDIFTFFQYVEMKGNESRCYCYLNSKNIVNKLDNDKMNVYKTTKEGTAPWLTQKENASRHVAPNMSTIQVEGLPVNVLEHFGKFALSKFVGIWLVNISFKCRNWELV